ncbi:MAG: GNAT family N-acetyltransferase [Elusimicrobiota bacterium]|nr:GNAT family N-acetyltransferase [Elusimicrobiota bacterium]
METTEAKTIIKHIKTETTDWKNEFSALYPDPSFIEKALNYPHAHFAAFNKKEIVGHALIQYREDKWVLGALVVKAEFRERGIGKALTQARIDFAKELGIKKLWYESKNANLVSICCHVSLGFNKKCSHGQNHCTPATTHWYYLEVPSFINPESN